MCFKAFLLRRQNTTNVTRIAAVSLQKRRESRTSSLHDSKNNERLAFRACTTQKTTTVSRFALARLKKRRHSRISRLHESKSDHCPAFPACTTPKPRNVSPFRACTTNGTNVLHFAPKTTKVSHFPRARLEKRRASNFTHVASPGDDSCEDGAYSLGWFLQTMECFNFRGKLPALFP